MPIPVIQYQPGTPEQINPFHGALKHALETYQQGVKTAYLKPTLQQQLEAQQYENMINAVKAKFAEPNAQQELQKSKLYNQYYGPNIQSEISNRNALTNKYNTMTPLEAEAQRILNKYGPQREQANINWRNMGGAGAGVGAKEEFLFQQLISKDNPQLNNDPVKIYEASNVLRQGGNKLSDGTQLNPLSPAAQSSFDRIVKGTTTSGLITKGVQANAGEAELNVLNKYAQEGIKLAGDTYFGKSPAAIALSFKNDDESQTKLGKIIGGNALQYAIAQIRNRIDMGEPGITATHEIMQSSGQLLDSYTGLNGIRLTAKARKYAMDTISEATREALKARNE